MIDNRFESPEIEIIELDNKDVITTSYSDSGYDGEWDDFDW